MISSTIECRHFTEKPNWLHRTHTNRFTMMVAFGTNIFMQQGKNIHYMCCLVHIFYNDHWKLVQIKRSKYHLWMVANRHSNCQPIICSGGIIVIIIFLVCLMVRELTWCLRKKKTMICFLIQNLLLNLM